MLISFIVTSLRSKSPVLDLSLFKNRVFTTANLAGFFLGAAFLSLIIFLPLFLVNVVGVSATRSGLSVIPLSLGTVFGAIVSGQVVSRIGRYKELMLGGGVVLAIGMFLLSRMTVDTPYWQVTLYMVVCGLGVGPSLPLYTLAIQNAVDFSKLGQATSASQFFRQIGGTMGAAIMGTVLATSLASSFSAANLPGGDFGGEGSVVSGGLEQIGSQIKSGFDANYALLEKFFRDNDPSALQELLKNPQLPAEQKTQLDQGSPRAGFDKLYTAIEAAVKSGDSQVLEQVLASSPLPAQAKTGIELGAQAAFSNSQAVEPFLAQVKSQFDTQATEITDQALAAIRTQFDTQAEQLTTDITKTLKQGFATAITKIYSYLLFAVIAGIIITALIPQLELRKTNHSSPAVEI